MSAADPRQDLVGRPVGRDGPSVAPDPVNQPMIRHWAAAFEDRNPVSTDPEVAATSRFGEIVAPPFMLQAWTMPTPTITCLRERGGAPVAGGGDSLIAVLDAAGYVATLATDSVRDPPLRARRRSAVVDHDHGVDLGGEGDARGCRALRDLAHHGHRRHRRGRRASAVRILKFKPDAATR